jgi:hypothetical protein
MKDWVLEDNLRPWLEIVSGIVGYAFDDWDWDAVQAGVVDTDSEHGPWYEYPLGARPTTIRLAREPGTAIVAVSLESIAEPQRDLIELAISISQSYRVEGRLVARGND